MNTPSEKALALCYAIEALGASEKLTKCSVLASDLRQEILALEYRFVALTQRPRATFAPGQPLRDLLQRCQNGDCTMAWAGNEVELYIQAEIATQTTRLREALQFIVKHGGMTHDTECGEIQCTGFWCADQARAALASTEATKP